MNERLSEPEKFAIYVHLPFCLLRCPYCDFFSSQVRTVPAAEYTAAVHREWQVRRKSFEGMVCESLYVGGGTPSLWSYVDLALLLKPLLALEPVEVTVEANPADVDERWFGALVEVGVNRFSLGVQALDDNRLAILGRRHDADQALRSIEQALSSGAQVSADLIYATPGSTCRSIAAEAKLMAEKGVSHVSAYELTLAEGTSMWQRVLSGELHAVGDDEAVDQWHAVEEALERAGLLRYEVSSFAAVSRQCRHNLLYWRGGFYAGLGAGAHGHLQAERGRIRYSNGKDIERYLRQTPSCPSEPLAGGTKEVVSPYQGAIELVMLGLRTTQGVDWSSVNRLLTPQQLKEFDEAAARAVSEGHARWTGDRLLPTSTGMLLADEIAAWFLD